MNNVLKKQLKRSGAGEHEARELSELASRLHQSANLPHLDRSTKDAIAADIGFKPKRSHALLHFAELSLATTVFAVVIVFAQSAQPGSALYGIKRGSEKVRVLVQPSYKKEVEKRRAEEQLKQIQQETQKIDQTVPQQKPQDTDVKGVTDQSKTDQEEATDKSSDVAPKTPTPTKQR